MTGHPLSSIFRPPKEQQKCPVTCETCTSAKKTNKCLSKNCVCVIECRHCHLVYKGETSRSVGSRIKEHLRMEKQTIYQHLIKHTNMPMLKDISSHLDQNQFALRSLYKLFYIIRGIASPYSSTYIYYICRIQCNDSSVVQKTKILFLSITLDHAHEQVNAIVKGEGGALGLSEKPTSLRGWVVGSSELAQMVDEFNKVILISESQNHHENRTAIQNDFPKDVANQVSSFAELGIPFKEVEGNLRANHTNDVMDEEIVWTVRAVRQLG